MTKRFYLGDSVYLEMFSDRLKLTTENGLDNDPSNTIILENWVLENLLLVLNSRPVKNSDENN